MRADLTIPMEFWGSEGKLKFGANNVYRTRDYEISARLITASQVRARRFRATQLVL